MRLGQLARKLDVRPAEIAAFLAQHNSIIDIGSNVRLNEEQVVLVMKHFAPDETFVPEPQKASIEPPDLPVEEVEQKNEEVSMEESASGLILEKPELIKAPKVELAGLKVLGKIDLPELRKKEEKAAEPQQEAAPEAEPKRNEQKPFRKKEYHKPRPVKNPVAMKRERETQEAEKKKQLEAELKKQKQRDHYLSKMKSVPAPVKPVRKVEEPFEEIDTANAQPMSRWKKFLRWWIT